MKDITQEKNYLNVQYVGRTSTQRCTILEIENSKASIGPTYALIVLNLRGQGPEKVIFHPLKTLIIPIHQMVPI